jgi:CRP-like cAMP-binding protein
MSGGLSLSGSEDQITLNRGDVLFATDDISKNLYLVKAGQIVLFRESTKHLIPETIINDKEFIGDNEIFIKEKHLRTAIATVYSEVIIIKKSEIQDFFKNAPQWVGSIAKVISERLNNSLDILQEHNLINQIDRSLINFTKDDEEIFLASLEKFRSKK